MKGFESWFKRKSSPEEGASEKHSRAYKLRNNMSHGEVAQRLGLREVEGELDPGRTYLEDTDGKALVIIVDDELVIVDGEFADRLSARVAQFADPI